MASGTGRQALLRLEPGVEGRGWEKVASGHVSGLRMVRNPAHCSISVSTSVSACVRFSAKELVSN